MDTAGNHKSEKEKTSLPSRITPLSFLITFALTLCFWLLFSGRFDLFHICLGLVCCFFVSIFSCRLLFPSGLSLHLFKCWPKFILYLPWLLGQILKANLHVLYLTFHPNMKQTINPKIIRFNTRLKSDLSRTVFANSITLTPGTITIYAGVLGRFAVHCIDETSGKGLPGDMENKIAKVFDE